MDVRGALSRGIILDTNLLLVLGIGLVQPALVGRFKRTEAYSPNDFRNLRGLVQSSPRLVTTPHVLTEFSNLLFRPLFHHRLRSERVLAAVRQMTGLHVEKDVLIEHAALARLGFTDLGIAHVARRDHYLVLTDDESLFCHLSGDGCVVINVNHLRSREFIQGGQSTDVD
ncbi:hypothetical protein RAS1_37210 [Phycisphaerae bacterium RAS1]|nr:hypothetical protein RAS1_37210 [Phycisphaerae bacterium RAS1]